MRIRDLTGEKFGRLLVIKKVCSHTSPGGSKSARWECLCDCGSTKHVLASHLVDGSTKSCGCLARELLSETKSTHRETGTRLYRVWRCMIRRCYARSDHAYHNYGGRGITVCDEWRHDYVSFRNWAYSNGYDDYAPRGACTLDRIDVNKNYCPENCRFVSMRTQSNNKRENIYITYNGQTDTASNWISRLGLNRAAVYKRLYNGWDPVRAITEPIHPRRKAVANDAR